MKKGPQICLGIFSSLLAWIVTVLLCGQIPLGEMFYFHRLKIGFFAPVFLLLYAILIAVLGKKKDLEDFFKSAIITFSLPLLFALIGNLFTFFSFSIGFAVISNYFTLFGAAVFSVLSFFSDYFRGNLSLLVYLFMLLLPGLSACVYKKYKTE